MSAEVYYRFFQATRLLGEGTVEAPFTVGRQTDLRLPAPVTVLDVSPNTQHYVDNDRVGRKLVIVPLSNRAVPRLSLRIDVDRDGNLLAHNLHLAVELHLPSREPLRPQEQLLLGRDGTICFPDEYQLRLTYQSSPVGGRAGAGGGTLAFAVDEETPTPRAAVASGELDSELSDSALENDGAQLIDNDSSEELEANAAIEFDPHADNRNSFVALDPVLDESDEESTHLLTMMAQPAAVNHQRLAVRLVRAALEAFREPPGSKEFFDAAGRAAIHMIDLDRVAVLRKDSGEWSCRTLSFRPGLEHSRAATREFSQTLLAQMELNGRTTCVAPQLESQGLWHSIVEIDRAVAAPIFDEQKTIVGALYGDRLIGESKNHEPIGELEAALLEVIASGISSSLTIKNEQRLRSSMDQFFSPVVLDQLRQDPTLLDGRVADVSVLFCDIRGFSSVTERIGPTQAVAWINDVLTTLSQCVLAHDGVLVDYIGDELMAMWGAPGEQTDHARRACLAAVDMLAHIAPLREKWKSIVPERFDLGIGINSGPASVGNTGSKQKFKYGPIGNTVNLASRVQGITKQVGIPGLITGQTANQLSNSTNFATRRLATVRVVGIAEPLELFELRNSESNCTGENSDKSDAAPINELLCTRYEKALKAYEAGDLKRAAGGLASLVQDFPDDRPTIILLSRVVELLTQPDLEFDPVWNLTKK